MVERKSGGKMTSQTKDIVDRQHLHRLVQDENAKTILLNVPLEVSTTSDSKPSRLRGSSPRTTTTTTALPDDGRKASKGSSTKRVRSASVGRDKKSDLQARYWAFLFENLRRAVDDLYRTCESDDSIPAAKEVILVFENYVRDFRNLADWLRLKWEYENTPPPQRPTSLTWEVRKTPPASSSGTGPGGKLLLTPTTMLATQRLLLATPAKRVLDFDLLQDGKKKAAMDVSESIKEVDVTPVDDKENLNGNEVVLKSPMATKPKGYSTVTKASVQKQLRSNSATTTCVKTRQTSSSLAALAGRQHSVSKATTTNGPQVTNKVGGNVMNKSSSSDSSTLSTSSQSQKGVLVKKTAVKNNCDISPKSQRRVSLVARQARFANGQQQQLQPSGRSLLIRSATTPSLRGRGSTGRTLGPASSSARGSKPPIVNGNKTNTNPPPFGSTSSISSSSSNRSWADTVKGLKAPRSVESLVTAHTTTTTTTTTTNNNNGDISSSGNKSNQPNAEDDGGGSWKTVRSRTRSKFSPSNHVKNKVTKQGSFESAFVKVKHSAKTRFSTPTSAISLPSLKSSPPVDKPEKKVKPCVLRPTKSASAVMKRDRQKPTNLERVAETGSNASSSENLCEDNVNKMRKKKKLEIDKADKVESQDETSEADIVRHDAAIALAEKEEENLAREILETEKSELTDVDGEGDELSDTETKANKGTMMATPPSSKYETLFEGLSWAEQMDLEEQLLESRYPGRAIQLHEKLSSPARKREPKEAFRHHQEKQKNARMRRQKFVEEKANKLSALNARIEEVIVQKECLISERKDMIVNKMAKAEAKRQEHIDGIRKKAREEEAKLKEIAFINELQAQNARIDMLAQNQTADEKAEERLAELAEERAKKAEQREAKEARAEKKRRAIEEKRQKDVEALRERIRTREERIHEEQEQARKERQEAAREKARDREEKLSTVKRAEKDMKEKRQEKIQQKQEDAAKRHKEKLALIRHKAFELSIQRCSTDEGGVPLLLPYEPKKKCEICCVLIANEVHLQSHLRGKRHCENAIQFNNGVKLSGEEIQIQNLTYIVDAASDDQDPKVVQSRERHKAMKRRAKKIKTRMATRAAEFEKSFFNSPSMSANKNATDGPNRAKVGKSIRDIEKLLASQGKGCWPDSSVSALERALGELSRAFDKKHAQDQSVFFALGGFSTLAKLFHTLADQKQSCVVPLKSIVSCSNAWALACKDHRANTEFVLKSNHMTAIIDILLDRLQVLVPDKEVVDFLPDINEPQVDPVAKHVMALLAQTLENLCGYLKEDNSGMNVRAQDQISYIVAVGIVDKLSAYSHSVRDPIDGRPEVADFLLSSLKFLSALTGTVEALNNNVTADKPGGDPTHLWKALEVTDLAGTVELLYGMLLHQGAPSRGSGGDPPKVPAATVSVVNAAAHLLHRMVRQHLTMVQHVLSQEGISLEFRHIVAYLLWYCQFHGQTDLLHEAIILVGFFSARHTDNQIIVQSGHQPSVLQQLCNLPFTYFSQPHLKQVLFPTLLACCHNNKENTGILSREMSWKLIDEFLQSPEGKSNHLVQLVTSSS